jgi:hypothetical protein
MRVSRSVLREAGGEIPPAYSPNHPPGWRMLSALINAGEKPCFENERSRSCWF